MDFLNSSLASVQIGGTAYALTAGKNQLQGICAEINPAVYENSIDYTCRLVNTADGTSPSVTAFYGLDLTIPCAPADTVLFNGLSGDDCGPNTFLPIAAEVTADSPYHMEPIGGRSSNTTAFPFFDLSVGNAFFVFGLGWTGQWFCDITRTAEGVRITAGQKDCNYVLYAGEAARSLRVLIYSAPGTLAENRLGFRETMRSLCLPYAEAPDTFHPPMAVQVFDRYYWNNTPGFRNEQAQIDLINRSGKTKGFDTFWIDALWFRNAFPEGVGNYEFESGFPNGMKKISQACHDNNLKLMLWFEPERIDIGSDTYRDHPEFLLDCENSGRNRLLNLGDPAACQWISDTIIGFMKENGIDIFRTDFNFEPLPYWQAADAPDRVGMTEMRYVEGLYRFWDNLRAAFPGLLIDNCASGGRRLDVETLERSVSCWRSDTGCTHENEHHRATVWAQNQGVCLSRYLPFHQTSVWEPVAYDVRSSMSESTDTAFDMLPETYDPAPHAEALAEVYKYRPWRRGITVPLTPVTNAEDIWFAYTLTLKGEGCAFAFRREACQEKKFLLKLPELDTGVAYECELSDEQRRISKFRLSGAALADGITLVAEEPRQSFVLTYRKIAE